MSRRRLAYAAGYEQALRDTGWECGDCGNAYDATVEACPNTLLDRAKADLRAQRRVEEDEPEPTTARHLPECPVADGPCCPWLGDCSCQCLCDLLVRVEQRVRGGH